MRKIAIEDVEMEKQEDQYEDGKTKCEHTDNDRIGKEDKRNKIRNENNAVGKPMEENDSHDDESD